MKMNSKIMAVLFVCLTCISVASATAIIPVTTNGLTTCVRMDYPGPSVERAGQDTGTFTISNSTDGFSVTVTAHTPKT